MEMEIYREEDTKGSFGVRDKRNNVKIGDMGERDYY